MVSAAENHIFGKKIMIYEAGEPKWTILDIVQNVSFHVENIIFGSWNHQKWREREILHNPMSGYFFSASFHRKVQKSQKSVKTLKK